MDCIGDVKVLERLHGYGRERLKDRHGCSGCRLPRRLSRMIMYVSTNKATMLCVII